MTARRTGAGADHPVAVPYDLLADASAGRVMSAAAGQEMAGIVRSMFGASVAVEGLQVQLRNGQGAPSIISTAEIPTASTAAPGAMSAADKAKLDGVQAGANAYVLPTAGNNRLGGVRTTSAVDSAEGYTPAPIIDGVPYYRDTDTTYKPATGSAAGLMSAADKAKLDGVQAGATKTVVDAELSESSENPVQNKAVKAALDRKAQSAHTHAASEIASGTLAADRLPTVPISKGGTGATDAASARAALGVTLANMGVKATAAELNHMAGVTSGVQAQLDGKANATHGHAVDQVEGLRGELDGKAPVKDPALTGVPTAPTAAAGTSTAQIATTKFVQDCVSTAVTGSSAYQGAANAYDEVTSTAYRPGWYWFVRTSGVYAGEQCEPGDMIIANAAKGASAKDSDFDVIQSNVDYVSAQDVRAWFA